MFSSKTYSSNTFFHTKVIHQVICLRTRVVEWTTNVHTRSQNSEVEPRRVFSFKSQWQPFMPNHKLSEVNHKSPESFLLLISNFCDINHKFSYPSLKVGKGVSSLKSTTKCLYPKLKVHHKDLWFTTTVWEPTTKKLKSSRNSKNVFEVNHKCFSQVWTTKFSYLLSA